MTTRAEVSESWSPPVTLGSTVNSALDDTGPRISQDGRELYFASNRGGGHGDMDLYVSTRASQSDAWGPPINLGAAVNSPAHDAILTVSADGLELYFQSARLGGYGNMDLWVTTRATKQDAWRESVNVGPTVNSSAFDGGPEISPDGLTLLFNSSRDRLDLWMTRRKTRNDMWQAPASIGDPDKEDEFHPSISADGLSIYFCDSPTPRLGGYGLTDLWRVPITPIVDFNADGKVDGFEVCAMADRWGTDDSLCDISPVPWGDGVVDVEDLKALAMYIGGDVDDPTLIAHWTLDEAVGDVAHDIASGNDGVVLGGTIWRPDAGAVDGALGFDGVDARVETPFVADPADGFLIALAWVKGSAAGQVIVSQSGGHDWLLTDVGGALMTDLKGPGRQVKALYSEAVITDGEWHRIGLAWHDTKRTLQVDDMPVAADEPGLAPRIPGTLRIGAGANLEPASFFTGLIDDVRIYNRAVRP